MRILVLGGTAFVGRAVVAEALDAGAHVTLFGRGRTGTELFPEAARLVGDRDTGDLDALRAGSWDAVVDVSGYLPGQVGAAMDALGDRVGRYLFISTNAVYQEDGVGPGADESTPTRPPVRTVARVDDLDNATYGPSKVACEDDIRDRFGGRATIVRAGQLVGPHDENELFAYWVRRAARGGRVAMTADPAQPVQVLDVRDLAVLVRRLVEDDRGGVFNAMGPAEPTTLGGLVETCAAAAGTSVELVRTPAEAAAGAPRLPFVRAAWASQQRDTTLARAAGLPGTPLARTAADVLAWDRGRGEPPLSCGLSEEQERALLAGLSGDAARS
ncbi:NAD-dependent epimerase/dehydratase family protein [Streptacidiphilus rugosus]|uniref:NAD-dependent epimerase/dehydratase family protein n=1 Tax=Streptacidiphilus rugosus TaxID=405783 RepID=UPI00055ED85C|nr:NAD-dependent epimerase/dehydratase family protein [Streptacidiphilus rugosus]